MRALIISADGFEESELLQPRQRLQEEGISVDISSPQEGLIRGKHGHEVAVDIPLQQVDSSAYELLILPGGKAPAKLRLHPMVLDITRQFFREGKPIAAICHGPQVLLSAGVLKGKTATCYKTVAGEMKRAGVDYVDKAVVVDGDLITSRQPSDLPLFIQEILNSCRRR
jgi:protease I